MTSIHRIVRKPIGMRIEVAADVLEPYALEVRGERPGCLVQRLQPGMLHPVLALHLLDEQQRIRADRDSGAAARRGILERGKQSSILRNVVGRRANRLTEFIDKRPVRTLDADNANRGMKFDGEMVMYCGREARVLRRVEQIIDEKTGRMLRFKNPCIVLEDVTCTGAYHRQCPRGIYPYWREIWLERVE